MAPNRVFLATPLDTNFTWSKPIDWNPGNNKVECIGAGGRGGGNFVAPLADGTVPLGGASYNPGFGGGGGAYAYRNNVNPTTWPVTCRIGSGGARLAGDHGYGGTYFNQPNDTTTNAQSVYAEAGMSGGGVGNAGATGGRFPWPQGYEGGHGSTTIGLFDMPGNGGGGAAGPHGAGSNAAGQNGSAGDGGNAPATAWSSASGQGSRHFCWETSQSTGGGGPGGNNSTGLNGIGNSGGPYGAGGGGNGSRAGAGPGGPGSQGLIVITWEPLLPSKTGRAIIMP